MPDILVTISMKSLLMVSCENAYKCKFNYDLVDKLCLKIEKDFDNKHIKYHIEFFRGGINAIIKLWLNNGCKETPKEMEEILKREYRGR